MPMHATMCAKARISGGAARVGGAHLLLLLQRLPLVQLQRLQLRQLLLLLDDGAAGQRRAERQVGLWGVRGESSFRWLKLVGASVVQREVGLRGLSGQGWGFGWRAGC